MTGDQLLARLMAQSEARGVDLVTLRALVEEASQAGASRALGALGLDDARARRDMDELRELLSAWRDAKRGAWQAMVAWTVRKASRRAASTMSTPCSAGAQASNMARQLGSLTSRIRSSRLSKPQARSWWFWTPIVTPRCAVRRAHSRSASTTSFHCA